MSLKNKITFLIVLIISFLLITIGVVTKNPYLTSFDQSIFAFVNTNHFPTFLNTVMLTITKFCDPYESLSIFIVFGTFLITRRRKISFYVLTISVGLGIVLPQIIKHVIEKVRPVSTLLAETGSSFPSAHATISTVFLLTIILVVAPAIKNNILRISLITLTWIIFPLVALSRIYLSVHWTSDVLVGVVLGFICYITASLSVPIFYKNKQ